MKRSIWEHPEQWQRAPRTGDSPARRAYAAEHYRPGHEVPRWLEHGKSIVFALALGMLIGWALTRVAG